LTSHSAALETEGWKETFKAITDSIDEMVWPPGNAAFRIPRKIQYLDGTKKKWLRNGVTDIKALFQNLMKQKKWLIEHSLSLAPYFVKHRVWAAKNGQQILSYPSLTPIDKVLKENVGDFDFLVEHETGFKTIVEWETGNISSSHRSLNKMCMALWADLCDAAVLVVPSRKLYEHLTDRIGNVTEIEPYFYFYNRAAYLADRKLLVVVVVEHDEDFYSEDIADFIGQGSDGNAESKPAVIVPVRKVARQSRKKSDSGPSVFDLLGK
jgi:Restriction endonuclease BamHI